ILANALCYVPQLIWLSKAPYGHKYREKHEGAPPRQVRPARFTDMFSTMREISSNRTIVTMLLVVGAYALFVGNAYQAQMPEFAHDLGHGEAGWHYSMLLGAHAAGAFIAVFVLESRGMVLARPVVAIRLAIAWGFVMT